MLNTQVRQEETIGSTLEHALWLQQFIDIYQRLSVDNLELLAKIYHPDVTFQDPMHEIHGFDELNQYFHALYENLISCRFEITQVITQDDQAAVYWQMSYQHPSLNRGKTVVVEGNSMLKGLGDKVIYHRDYLDLGAMLYEHIPVIGRLTKWVKNRASQS